LEAVEPIGYQIVRLRERARGRIKGVGEKFQ